MNEININKYIYISNQIGFIYQLNSTLHPNHHHLQYEMAFFFKKLKRFKNEIKKYNNS